MPNHVFLSYAREDLRELGLLCSEIERLGWRCFYAPRDLEAGDVWVDALEVAIDGAAAFIVVVTGNARRSTWVRKEVEWVLRRKPQPPILVLLFEIIHPDKSWVGECAGHLHHLDVTRWIASGNAAQAVADATMWLQQTMRRVTQEPVVRACGACGSTDDEGTGTRLICRVCGEARNWLCRSCGRTNGGSSHRCDDCSAVRAGRD